MILSWLQNHLETLGGRAAWSWHFSCMQTVVKLQFAFCASYPVPSCWSILIFYALSSRSWDVGKQPGRFHRGCLSAIFLPWVCRSAPHKQPPLSCRRPWKRNHCSWEVFFCLKTRVLLTCTSSSTDFFFSSSFSEVGWFTKSSER